MAKYYYAGVENRFGFLSFISGLLYFFGVICLIIAVVLFMAGKSALMVNPFSAAFIASSIGAAIFYFALGGLIQLAVALEYNQREQIEYARMTLEAMPDPEPKASTSEKEKALS